MRWVVFDTSAMMHRAWHAMQMNSKHLLTVLWAQVARVLRRTEVQGAAVVFAFDSARSLRREELSPNYKKRKRQHTVREAKEYKRLHLTIDYLRMKLLPSMGIQALCWDGLEADDMIAAAAESMIDRLGDRLFIVSADSDLFQCLRSNVSMLHLTKGQIIDVAWLHKVKGVSPVQWRRVKAIGGCKSDGIRGVPGVGEKSAIAFVRGELKGAKRRCIEAYHKRIARNMNLVRLPYSSAVRVELHRPDSALCYWFWETIDCLRDNATLRRAL